MKDLIHAFLHLTVKTLLLGTGVFFFFIQRKSPLNSYVTISVLVIVICYCSVGPVMVYLLH